MPMVRSPCTLECPRTGQTPAPGLPIMPRSNSTLVISAMVATAWVCWVMPIAQHTTVRCDAATMSVTRRNCDSAMPVAASTSPRST